MSRRNVQVSHAAYTLGYNDFFQQLGSPRLLMVATLNSKTHISFYVFLRRFVRVFDFKVCKKCKYDLKKNHFQKMQPGYKKTQKLKLILEFVKKVAKRLKQKKLTDEKVTEN